MTARRETQATVATFDPEDRSGTVVLDDGVLLSYAGSTVARDVRGLRLGQRVRVIVDGAETDQSVVALTIITLSLVD